MSKASIFSIEISLPHQVKDFVIDEIRRRISNSFAGRVLSSGSVAALKATISNTLIEMERMGIFRHKLWDDDITGITELMMLEWSISNHYDSRDHTSSVPPDVRTICGRLSDQAISAMTASRECSDVGRFFALEKMRREGQIDDWDFRWTDFAIRAGDLTIV